MESECTQNPSTKPEDHSKTGVDKRPQFGGRFLTDSKNVFEHNAWDNVVWDEEQENEARLITHEQMLVPVTEDLQVKYEDDAGSFWDSFYTKHQNRFFKDRHWLFTEFPELEISKEPQADNTDTVPDVPDVPDVPGSSEELSAHKQLHYPGAHAKYRILEVGCGVGNTVFPILQTNNDPDLMVYCCDFSSTAIELVKEHADYNPDRCHAFVYDVTDDVMTMPFPDASLDIIILIFVLSAVNPAKMRAVIERLSSFLKPGGVILFRDYGRYDMAQLRFKQGRCLSENFYVRGDGTRVYFFTQDELREMFSHAGLTEEHNLIDRRLQVNRGRQLKMYRVWIQCKYRKPTNL